MQCRSMLSVSESCSVKSRLLNFIRYVPSTSSYLSTRSSISQTSPAFSSLKSENKSSDLNNASLDKSAILLVTILQCSIARLVLSRKRSSRRSKSLLASIVSSLSLSSLTERHASFSSPLPNGKRIIVANILNTL